MKRCHRYMCITICLVMLLIGCSEKEQITASQSTDENCVKIEKESGIDIAFVIDGSGSMEENDKEKLRISNAKLIVEQMQENDRAIVISFDKDAELLSKNILSDKDEINATLDKIPSDNRYTDISKGIELALSELEVANQGNQKVIIALTDGENAGENKELTEEINKNSFQQADLANENNATIYTIGLGNNVDKALLSKLATTTGGKYFHAESNFALEEVYRNVIEEMKCLPVKVQVEESVDEYEEQLVKLTENYTYANIDETLSKLQTLLNKVSKLEDSKELLQKINEEISNLHLYHSNSALSLYAVLEDIGNSYGVLDKRDTLYSDSEFTGLLYSKLIDLNHDGVDELLVLFIGNDYTESRYPHRQTANMVLEIWGTTNQEAQLLSYDLYEYRGTLDGIYTIGIAEDVNKNPYIYSYNGYGRDEYYEELYEYKNLQDSGLKTKTYLKHTIDREFGNESNGYALLSERKAFYHSESEITEKEYTSLVNGFTYTKLFTADQGYYSFEEDSYSYLDESIQNTTEQLFSTLAYDWKIASEADKKSLEQVLQDLNYAQHYNINESSDEDVLYLLLWNYLVTNSEIGMEENEVNKQAKRYFGRTINPKEFKSSLEIGSQDLFTYNNGYYLPIPYRLMAGNYYKKFKETYAINDSLFYVIYNESNLNLLDSKYTYDDIAPYVHLNPIQWPEWAQLLTRKYLPTYALMKKTSDGYILLDLSYAPMSEKEILEYN